MTLEQFKEQLAELNKGLRSLPATAQVNQLAAAVARSLLLLATHLLLLLLLVQLVLHMLIGMHYMCLSIKAASPISPD